MSSGPVDFAEVIACLQARVEDVAERYAPGGRRDGGRYWALCPWRGDRKVGSFHVDFTGSYAGRWCEHATGEHGDMLDLIQRVINGSRSEAVREAMAFLGIAEETEGQRAQRRRQAEAAAADRRRREEAAAELVARKRAAAYAVWLRSDRSILGTPVEGYLLARSIGREAIGRARPVLRYHPLLPYRHVDDETGEVVEGTWPAMVAVIHGPAVPGAAPSFWGLHRTWLAEAGGRWGKAPVPAPKKVAGTKKAGFIRLAVTAGAERLYVTEGIEDGLSVLTLVPGAAVIAAVDLGNMAAIDLPPSVREVVLMRDNDADPKVARVAEAAVMRWLGEGRAVREWTNRYGGKDVNDALRAALGGEAAEHGAGAA